MAIDIKFIETLFLSVGNKDRTEVECLWSALTSNGGSEGLCGWLKDIFGVSWQIFPDQVIKLHTAPDASVWKAKSGMTMMQMKELNFGALESAFQA